MRPDELVSIIQGIGFPAAVVVWLLWERYHMHRENLRSINRLTDQIIVLTTLLSVATKIPVPTLVQTETADK